MDALTVFSWPYVAGYLDAKGTIFCEVKKAPTARSHRTKIVLYANDVAFLESLAFWSRIGNVTKLWKTHGWVIATPEEILAFTKKAIPHVERKREKLEIAEALSDRVLRRVGVVGEDLTMEEKYVRDRLARLLQEQNS